jgi:6-phosphogluconolactonase
MSNWKETILNFDERRDIVIPGDTEDTIRFCVEQFISIGQAAIKDHNFFAVALSGGQTPNAIYRKLSTPEYLTRLDWSRVICFWSDERSVPANSPESNYHNAMEAGLGLLPLSSEHVFRMPAENDIEENALAYEMQIRLVLPSLSFDLMMLGMGEDGHTASLFPKTHALHTTNRLVVANHVPQQNTWRMTLTYECINSSKVINIYALGKKKAEMVYEVLTGKPDFDHLPVQKIGTPKHKALWILDKDAGDLLMKTI